MSVTFAWPTERPHFAVVRRVVDGDTIRADIDLNLRTWLHDYPVRLIGCNAWEHNTEPGQAARANLAGLLPPGTPLTLTTVKDYKYGGEFCARVWVGDTDLVAVLIQDGWAAPWDGHGKAPLPPWPRPVA